MTQKRTKKKLPMPIRMLSNRHLVIGLIQRYTMVCLCIVLFCACGNRAGKKQVEFNRFEQLLFDTPVGQLQQVLTREKATYQCELLNVYPEDEGYMGMLEGFVTDPVMRDVYRVTDSLYHDLGWLETELGKALTKAEELCPAIHYDRFYTLITGDFENYQSRVLCGDGVLAISIDRYAVPEMGRYGYFGLPTYLVETSKREYIAADCMATIARDHIAMSDGEMTVLDYAIAEGKVLYFLEQVLPDCDDTILLRYTAEQLGWMEENVTNVWAWMIQNKMLYETDLSRFHNLIDEAPKTNAFGDGSAPRTPAYIGWQIVKRYMKKSGASMNELFEMTDSQRLLNESGWRP